MADYAGAVAAIKQRMIDNWTTTPIVFRNPPPDSYDPSSNAQQAWVYFEVVGNGSELRGAGKPGDHIWIYRGFVFAHVFVPARSGDELARQYAVAIGEIFRAQGFYNDGSGAIVRTWAPRTDDGGSALHGPQSGIINDDGNWFRVTCSIPFEYLHRG